MTKNREFLVMMRLDLFIIILLPKLKQLKCDLLELKAYLKYKCIQFFLDVNSWILIVDPDNDIFDFNLIV